LVSEARTITFKSFPDRFVSIIHFLRVPNEQLPSKSSVLAFSIFRLFFFQVLFCNSYHRRSLSNLYRTRYLRQCKLKGARLLDRWQKELEFRFRSTRDKNFERRWKHRNGLKIAFKMSLKPGSRKWKYRCFKCFLCFFFCAKLYRNARHTKLVFIKETAMRIFQGKWNIFFKINATINFFEFQVPRTIGSVYKKFFLTTYDAYVIDARVACTPYCFQFLIRISDVRYHSLLWVPIANKRERNREDQYSFKKLFTWLLFIAAFRTDWRNDKKFFIA